MTYKDIRTQPSNDGIKIWNRRLNKSSDELQIYHHTANGKKLFTVMRFGDASGENLAENLTTFEDALDCVLDYISKHGGTYNKVKDESWSEP